jgi:hypothetical protein
MFTVGEQKKWKRKLNLRSDVSISHVVELINTVNGFGSPATKRQSSFSVVEGFFSRWRSFIENHEAIEQGFRCSNIWRRGKREGKKVLLLKVFIRNDCHVFYGLRFHEYPLSPSLS